ncbi:MAG: Fur family transcriptional regulator [Finegoldia sp.]|nr:Fur family transcriptional regulator [Finegoldia sp.]
MDYKILRDNDLKITKPRKIILKIFEESKDPLSAEEIHKIYSKKNKSSLSTVYRNLKKLEDIGLIDVVFEMDGIAYYQLKKADHSHRIICKNCGKVIAIDNCPLEGIEERLEEETGFAIDSHLLEFRGLCPDCQKADR